MSRITKDGKLAVTVRLAPGEEVLVLKTGSYIKLGGQVDDVVGAHVLQESRRVFWCSVTQRWEEA